MRELLDSVIFLFAIVDAPGNLPIFMDLMEGMEGRLRRRVYDVATAAGFVIIVVFAVAGRFVLKKVFQIEVAEFEVAGGLLLAAIGIHAMVAARQPGATDRRPHGLEIAAVPIACPLLVGPGAIVTTMLIVERHGEPHALLAGAIVFALTRLIFWLDEPIRRALGNLGLLIFSRIMRIFIIAIGVHFIIAGVKTVFHLTP
jgi:multiple antibiotic resistance protein